MKTSVSHELVLSGAKVRGKCRFEFLDDTGLWSKPNVTEKTLKLISGQTTNIATYCDQG